MGKVFNATFFISEVFQRIRPEIGDIQHKKKNKNKQINITFMLFCSTSKIDE